MNPAKAKMVKEEPNHFVMTDGGSNFVVPKKDLSPSMADTIRSLGDAGAGAIRQEVGSSPQFSAPPSHVQSASFQPAPVNPEPIPPGLVMTEDPEAAKLAAARAQPGFNEAAYAAAKRGEFPSNGAAAYQSHAISVGDADKAMAHRAAASALGIVPRGSTPPAAPVAAVPAPPITTTPRTAGGGGGMPGVAEFNQATKDEQVAITAKGAAEADQSRMTAEALAEGDNVLKQHALQQQEIVAKGRAAADDALRKVDAATNEIRNMDTTVDPGRYWASRDTVGKISGIIGLALGALGSGPDGVNQAAQMLNQAVDRDIDAQKAEHSIRLQKGKLALDSAQSMFGMNQQILQNDLAADAATHATAWARIDNMLKRTVAASADPIAKANAAQLAAVAAEHQAKFKADAANVATDNYTQRMLAEAQIQAAGAKAGGNPAEQKELHSAEAAAQNSLDFISKIRQGLGKTNTWLPGGTAYNQNIGADAATLDVNQTGLILELKNLAKLGVLSKSDESILNKLAGDPASITTREGTKTATLNALEALVRRGIENQRKAVVGAKAK